YTLNFQISYPFTYSIINLSLYIFHHPRPVLDHSLNNIHKCITHACALKWESLELEKK
ncbi:unnamed protein product, partial [Brassica rapa]